MASRTPISRLSKILLWTPGILVAVLVVAVIGAKLWVEKSFLTRPLPVGTAVLRLHGATLGFNLDARADSLDYRDTVSGLELRVREPSLSLRLFEGIYQFRPRAQLTVDRIALRLPDSTPPDTLPKSPPPDSLPFPALPSLPLRAEIKVGETEIFTDSGTLARAGAFRLALTGPRKSLRASLSDISSPQAPGLEAGLRLRALWRQDSLSLRLHVGSASDSLHFRADLSQADLLRGTQTLRLSLRDSRRYTQALAKANPNSAAAQPPAATSPASSASTASTASSPGLTNLQVQFDMRTDNRAGRRLLKDWTTALAARLTLDADAVGLPDTGAVTLSRQHLSLEAAWDAPGLPLPGARAEAKWGPADGSTAHGNAQDTAVAESSGSPVGTLTLGSRGSAGEVLDLRARVEPKSIAGASNSAATPSTGADTDSASLETVASAWKVDLSGRLEGLGLRVGNEPVTASVPDLELHWDGDSLRARIETGDGSRVAARIEGLSGWKQGAFSLEVNPEERFLRAFVDTQIVFASLQGSGRLRDSVIEASLTASQVTAYGVRADSLDTRHRFEMGKRYVLLPSRLIEGSQLLDVSGEIDLAAPGLPMEWRVRGDSLGSVTYRQSAATGMDVEWARLRPFLFPYRFPDSLPPIDPVLDGRFRWHIDKRMGSASLQAEGTYQAAPFSLDLEGDWDADSLRVEKLDVDQEGSRLRAAGRVALPGEAFYDFQGFTPAHVGFASLKADRFDLAAVMRRFLPDPPLTSGVIEGDLAFGAAEGFQGRTRFLNIMPKADLEGTRLATLELSGAGDSLRLLAKVRSERDPLRNLDVRLAVSSPLRDTVGVSLRAQAGDSLHLRVNGLIDRFQSFTGSLALKGSLELPEGAGRLEGLDIALDAATPFQDAAKKMTVETRSVSGTLRLPDLPAQTFAVEAALREGRVQVAKLRIANPDGQTLEGHAVVDLSPDGELRAELGGSGFDFAWKDKSKISLRDLKAQARRENGYLLATVSLGRAELAHTQIPLQAEAALEGWNVEYRSPLAPVGQEATPEPARLTAAGRLDQSLIRYRLSSFSALKSLLPRRDRDSKPEAAPTPDPARKGPEGRSRPLELDIRVETAGDSNRIETDLLNLSYVGDLRMKGVHPYTLWSGRINGTEGSLGLGSQAYNLRQVEVKWLNVPVEDGRMELEARKRLASACPRPDEPPVTDSCDVITRLEGPLDGLEFTYDSDCGGAFGAGADVSALIFSVQRGCYDESLAQGGGDVTGKALSLLEPALSNIASQQVSRITGDWIERLDIGGLSRLANGGTDSAAEALSMQLTSKEYKRVRLKIKSGYQTGSQDMSNPWEHKLSVEWRPPMGTIVEDPKWRSRLDNHLRVEASLLSRARKSASEEEDPIEKKIGLRYSYPFWGSFWGRQGKPENVEEGEPSDSSATAGSGESP